MIESIFAILLGIGAAMITDKLTTYLFEFDLSKIQDTILHLLFVIPVTSAMAFSFVKILM